MTLRTQFNDSLKDAMRAKDQRAVSTIRMILAGLKDRDIAARTRGVTDGIDEAEILSMLQTLVKQRNESAGLYDQGGRPELAQQEREEIAVIERFLPKQMSEDESAAAIDAIVAELGASSIKDMGKVMAELKARHAGQMDFAKAGGLVKARLSGK
ncbi:GatB/YqeY domain-containing protein [Azospirillum sp. TSO5]|uniref:GatB/YqeY domain-containing protein n=1 Tax=Azospirillum sp. TSO5 TaxID=716760 RepID=UPI000D6126BD|nr:GatB/YqeY domain-containing protein [Azospirillum sp. TSO5]PWC95740.1 glutamyl-tRNA amidotransferase [Azospirillum sp. TSO5]